MSRNKKEIRQHDITREDAVSSNTECHLSSHKKAITHPKTENDYFLIHLYPATNHFPVI